MTSIQSSAFSAKTPPLQKMSRAMTCPPQTFGAFRAPSIKNLPKMSFFANLRERLNAKLIDFLGMDLPLLLRRKLKN